MQLIAFIINLPWTLILLIAGILSLPRKIAIHHRPFAIILSVRSFWWYYWLPSKRGVRAMTLGSVVLLGPALLDKDLEHELVHIKQHQREPLIHPILSQIETWRHGYRQNKYEDEAYATTNSTYIGNHKR